MKCECNTLRSLPQYRLFKCRPTCERKFLESSIKEKGVLVPLIADETLAILKGHQRFDIATALGIHEVPVEVVQGLNEEQKRDLILQVGSLHRSLTLADRRDLARNELLFRKGNISDSALGALVGLSDKTVKAVRERMLATSEIPNLPTRQGKDGIERPAAAPRKSRIIPVNSFREAVKAGEILREYGDDLPEGRLTLNRAKKQARLAHYLGLGQGEAPPPPAEFKAVRCDFMELLPKGHVKPCSVRLIYTDPPWANDWYRNWPDLAKVAREMLMEGGLLLAYTGNSGLPVAMDACQSAGLSWVSLISMVSVVSKADAKDHWKGIIRCFVPVVVFSKGEYLPITRGNDQRIYFRDAFQREGIPEKEWHPWQQGVAEAEYYISHLTEPGDLITDLCGGSFTTMIAAANVGNRRFVGCDIEERNIKIAWERFAQEATAKQSKAG